MTITSTCDICGCDTATNIAAWNVNLPATVPSIPVPGRPGVPGARAAPAPMQLCDICQPLLLAGNTAALNTRRNTWLAQEMVVTVNGPACYITVNAPAGTATTS